MYTFLNRRSDGRVLLMLVQLSDVVDRLAALVSLPHQVKELLQLRGVRLRVEQLTHGAQLPNLGTHLAQAETTGGK